MQISENGLVLTKQFEGLILKAYDDFNDRIVRPGQIVRGTLTIGYGHTTSAGPPKVYVGMEITKEQAEQILISDLNAVALEVAHLVKVPVNTNQADALIDFQFNCGWLGHPHCSLLNALNSGNYELADEDFMLYDRAQGKVLGGLSRRRKAEMTLFRKSTNEGNS